MEQFNLDKWLKDKSRKVVTRDGRPVRIVCWDRQSSDDDRCIVGLVDNGVREDTMYFDKLGHYSTYSEGFYDLFFADEEEELTEFDYAVLSIISDHNSHTDSIEAFAKRSSKKLLDLTIKELEKSIAVEFAKFYIEDVNPSFEKVQESEELRKWKMSCLRGINKAYKQGKEDALKDLPKWEKKPNGIQGNGDFKPTYLVRTSNGYYYTTSSLSWDEDSMYIELSELEKLPKEE